MKKKITSLVLALAMCLSLCVPAFAEETSLNQDDTVPQIGTIITPEGDEMKFELEVKKEGEYILNYYLNGCLDTVYSFCDDNDIIIAEKASQVLSLNTYSFRASQYVTMETVPEAADTLETSRTGSYFGRINYNNSVSAGNGVYITLTMTSRTVEKKVPLNAQAGDKVSDIVASFASVLSAGLVKELAAGVAALFGWPTIAATVVEGVISIAGAWGVNQTVKYALSEKVDGSVTEYSIYGEIHNLKFDVPMGTYRYFDCGAITAFLHKDQAVEYEEKGVLPTNKNSWAKSYIAEDAWAATTLSRYECPGVKSYV